MTPEEYIKQLVGAAPPLSDQQHASLYRLLGPVARDLRRRAAGQDEKKEDQ